jgi:hypothetical protein
MRIPIPTSFYPLANSLIISITKAQIPVYLSIPWHMGILSKKQHIRYNKKIFNRYTFFIQNSVYYYIDYKFFSYGYNIFE